MKVALMGAWNTDSGASIHAELVGRALVEKGIDLKVFSFFRHSFHGTALTKTEEEEEAYVERCFTVYGLPNPEMNTAPMLNEDFDIFMVEDLGMIPLQQLLNVFPQIKSKAKTVNVIHDGRISEKPEFFRFDWDHVVCFDERYRKFLVEVYPESKLSIIPYPSSPLQRGDMAGARKKLGLPLDKKVVLMFGQAAEFALDTTMALDRLADRYDIMLVLVTETRKILRSFGSVEPKVKFDIKLVEDSPSMDYLYDYLHAADCMIYNKQSRPVVVVASTIFQCMGSGCPILALESNFTQVFNKEILKHTNLYELEEDIVDVFEKGEKYQEQQRSIESYLKEKSAEPTAERFINLFESLLKKK